MSSTKQYGQLCRRIARACSLLALGLLAACASPPERQLVREVPDYVSLTNGRSPLNPAEPSEMTRRFGANGLIAIVEKDRGRGLNVLEISGGGQNGAFGAGVLQGWSDSGRMPEFDIVTGISVGALLSTFAFLGEAEDIEAVGQIFTTIDQSNIFSARSKLSVALGTDAFADSTPLYELIQRFVTQDVIDRVAAAYENGRLLYIGVLNLDFQQLWAFDMTALAASDEADRLETYRKLLLAAASPPIMFPPVEIGGHLYADGGARDRLLVAGLDGQVATDETARERGTIYVLFNDQATTQPAAITRDFRGIAASTVNALLDGQMETTVLRAYAVALSHGYEFRLLQVPDDLHLTGDALSFSPEDMQALFEAGRALGRDPGSWRSKPQPGQTVGPATIESLERLRR